MFLVPFYIKPSLVRVCAHIQLLTTFLKLLFGDIFFIKISVK